VTETPDVRHITNPDVMHEESDVNVKGVATFVLGLGIFGLIVLGLVFALYSYFNWREKRNEDREFHSPIARTDLERRPPRDVPHLQAAPGQVAPDAPDDPRANFELDEPQAEWKWLRQKYDFELTNYGQPDPSTNTVHVPIEDAMQRLLQQTPLPARQPQPGDPALHGGMDVPSDFSGGRQVEKRDQ
jgi:hypothetical protein